MDSPTPLCAPESVSRQLGLVVDALRLSASLLSRYPYMLAFEMLGRLLPLVQAPTGKDAKAKQSEPMNHIGAR